MLDLEQTKFLPSCLEQWEENNLSNREQQQQQQKKKRKEDGYIAFQLFRLKLTTFYFSCLAP